ncbi:anaerobic dehydrogenase [Acinetobacter baumannii]|nr:anaerobic dehydrogenase [Acinetobacter baumannii]
MSEFKKVSNVLLESNGIYFIECPGCKCWHPLHVGPQHKIRWNFDGNIEKPTFSPSLMVNAGESSQCHSFIRNGQIQFLSDCHHSLAGQTVDLPEIEEF